LAKVLDDSPMYPAAIEAERQWLYVFSRSMRDFLSQTTGFRPVKKEMMDQLQRP
jgi:hypothetical protein